MSNFVTPRDLKYKTHDMLNTYRALQANESKEKELLNRKSKASNPVTYNSDKVKKDLENKITRLTFIFRIISSIALFFIYVIIYGTILQPTFSESESLGFVSIIVIVVSIVVPIMLIKENTIYESFKKSKKHTQLLKQAQKDDEIATQQEKHSLSEIEKELNENHKEKERLLKEASDYKELYETWDNHIDLVKQYVPAAYGTNTLELIRQIMNLIPFDDSYTDAPLIIIMDACDKYEKMHSR